MSDYDMHADAHRPMIEPDETIGDYGARCYAAGRDDTSRAARDAEAFLASAHRMAAADLDKIDRLLRDIASIAARDADIHRTAAKETTP